MPTSLRAFSISTSYSPKYGYRLPSSQNIGGICTRSQTLTNIFAKVPATVIHMVVAVSGHDRGRKECHNANADERLHFGGWLKIHGIN